MNEDGMPRQCERLSRWNPHEARTGKAIHDQLPTRSDELPVGDGLCCLSGSRDQSLNQPIVIIEIHPQVELGLFKRNWLPYGRGDQLHGHALGLPSDSDNLSHCSLVACVTRCESRIKPKQLR